MALVWVNYVLAASLTTPIQLCQVPLCTLLYLSIPPLSPPRPLALHCHPLVTFLPPLSSHHLRHPLEVWCLFERKPCLRDNKWLWVTRGCRVKSRSTLFQLPCPTLRPPPSPLAPVPRYRLDYHIRRRSTTIRLALRTPFPCRDSMVGRRGTCRLTSIPSNLRVLFYCRPRPQITCKPRPLINYKPRPQIIYNPRPLINFKPHPQITCTPRPLINCKLHPQITYKPRPCIKSCKTRRHFRCTGLLLKNYPISKM